MLLLGWRADLEQASIKLIMSNLEQIKILTHCRSDKLTSNLFSSFKECSSCLYLGYKWTANELLYSQT